MPEIKINSTSSSYTQQGIVYKGKLIKTTEKMSPLSADTSPLHAYTISSTGNRQQPLSLHLADASPLHHGLRGYAALPPRVHLGER